MSKIAIIADPHFGNRSDSKHLLDNLQSFFDNVFFPYIDKFNIQHVINLGDTVDRRKYINFNTSKRLTQTLIEPLYQRGVESHVLIGNHDTFFKDTNSVNALNELYGNSKYLEKMKIYENPKYANVGGLDMLMLPWINDENRKVSYQLIEENKVKVAMGHLDMIGFHMYRNNISEHGLDKDLFRSYNMVCSGHYHHKSSQHNIHYLGSVGQYTWADYGDARGFHILDTETMLLEFIHNPYYLFNKIIYDDSAKSETHYMNMNINEYKNSYIKIIVKNKTNPYCLEKFVERFENLGIINLQIIEDKLTVELENEEELLSEAEDTLTLLKKYIDSMNIDNRAQLEKFMNELYFEASSIA